MTLQIIIIISYCNINFCIMHTDSNKYKKGNTKYLLNTYYIRRFNDRCVPSLESVLYQNDMHVIPTLIMNVGKTCNS